MRQTFYIAKLWPDQFREVVGVYRIEQDARQHAKAARREAVKDHGEKIVLETRDREGNLVTAELV